MPSSGAIRPALDHLKKHVAEGTAPGKAKPAAATPATLSAKPGRVKSKRRGLTPIDTSVAIHALAEVKLLSFLHLGLAAVLLNSAAATVVPPAVFIVRHADRGPEEPDAHLTPLGLRQADELAAVLADAGIKHIFTTELTRTRQTAAPTARQAGITPVVVPQDDFDGLVARIRSTLHAGAAILVVGHRSTVPRLVKALGGGEITPLAFDEFTRLIVLVPAADDTARVVTLRYGRKPGP